jgi:hypothetical protein
MSWRNPCSAACTMSTIWQHDASDGVFAPYRCLGLPIEQLFSAPKLEGPKRRTALEGRASDLERAALRQRVDFLNGFNFPVQPEKDAPISGHPILAGCAIDTTALARWAVTRKAPPVGAYTHIRVEVTAATVGVAAFAMDFALLPSSLPSSRDVRNGSTAVFDDTSLGVRFTFSNGTSPRSSRLQLRASNGRHSLGRSD